MVVGGFNSSQGRFGNLDHSPLARVENETCVKPPVTIEIYICIFIERERKRDDICLVHTPSEVMVVVVVCVRV